MKRIILIIFILTTTLLASPQDTIVLTTGVKIPCKVTLVDSTYVYYVLTRKKEVRHTTVRTEYVQVINYYDTLSVPKNPGRNPTRMNHNYVALAAGMSLATGVYASQDINSEKAGFAGTGFTINLSLTHQFVSMAGISVKGFYSSNRIILDKVVEDMSLFYNAPVLVNKVSYHVYGAMVGPDFSVPFKRLSLLGGLYIGYAGINLPEITYIIDFNYGYAPSVIRSKESGSSFVFDVSGGLSFSVNKRWELFTRADYMYGNFKFGFYTFNFSNGSFTSYSGYKQKYGAINISVGSGFKF